MVKSIAEKHGLRATFMPKPFANLTGSGCHVHVSLWQGDTNAFEDDKDALGLSKTGYHFIGGVMDAGRGALRHHQPDGELLQADQRAGDALGRDLVAQHRHLHRQQPHPHDPHSRRRPLRAPPRRRRRQSLSPAGGDPRRRPRRHRQEDRSRQAARHQHVYRGPQGAGRTPRSCRSTCSTRSASPRARSCSAANSAPSSSMPTSS